MPGSNIKSSQPRGIPLEVPTTLEPRNGGEPFRVNKSGLDGTSTKDIVKSSSTTGLGPKQSGL